ncbi:M15 family metallopeptidase [Gordonia sinesedis]
MRPAFRPILFATVTAAVALGVGCATGDPTSGAASASPTAGHTTPQQSSAAPHLPPAASSGPNSRPRDTSTRHPANSPARAALGFVDVRDVLPDAIVDLRYATPNNFTRTRLYPPNARCLVHESLRPGLVAAQRALGRSGNTLVFWDCYRPHSVQEKMFRLVPDPAWVAQPESWSRSHESGRSVDVTLANRTPTCPTARRVADRCLVDMGTDFDSFTPQATAFATTGVSSAQRATRSRLRTAMNAGGLTVYSGEWWHFDGPGAQVRRPIIDIPPT